MSNPVEIGGVLHHRGPAVEAGDILACIGGRHGTVVEHHDGPIGLAARLRAPRTEKRTDLVVFVVGTIENRAALDDALDTRGASDSGCVAAAYQRFGVDAGARIFGQWAAVLWDAEHRRLVLFRAAGVGGSPSIHYVRDGRRTSFSTRLTHIVTSDWATQDLVHWASVGRWPSAERGPYAEVEAVAPGQAVVVTEKGRTSKHRVWSFVPLVIPRELPASAARQGLSTILSQRLSPLRQPVRVVGESHVAEHLSRHLSKPPTEIVERLTSQDPHALLRAARLVELPVPLSKLLTLSKLLWNPGADVVVDWGAREGLGGTTTAMRAWVQTIARAIDSTPRPSTYWKVAKIGWPVDRRLGAPRLHRHVWDVTKNVGRRWSNQLPANARQRLLPLLEDDTPSPAWAPEPVTGDLFTDLRFAEVTDASFGAAHTALVRLAQTHGRRAIAPFLTAEVIELVFALPARYFVQDRRAMWILGGGVEVGPVVTPPRPQSLAMRLDDWLTFATDALATKVEDDASIETLDRWFGLAAWLESRRA